MLANQVTAARRSEGDIPRSVAESNGMLSWRGAADRSVGTGEFFMLLLLDDGRIVPGALSETALGQQLMQLSQRRQCDARRAERHSGTGGRIEHPSRHHDDYAGRHLDMNDVAAGAPLDILAPKAAPIKCVPAIMDLDVLPDMGRMTGRLRLVARIICSPVPMPAAAAPLHSTP
jgi:hypothetical protein